MVLLTETPLDVRALEAAVRDPGHGALLTFAGVARDDGTPPLRALYYEAWTEVAERELREVADETLARWPTVKVAIAHRVGEVAVGEPSVVVTIGAPHREEAYAASRFAIDTLKARVRIWKKEIYADGGAWVANRVAPDGHVTDGNRDPDGETS
ncbi:MAG: molybdenum cofactor biosynthesis protein MoaE [Pseudomonadota bacterium]|nr:molybdenum cofactor biosynthesis protein MoaE [Pseudomonadota bacterium]